MILPFVAYILGLFAVSAIHTFLSPAVDALFAASTNTGPVMTLLHASWTYFPLLYAFVGATCLLLYAVKSRGGGFG